MLKTFVLIMIEKYNINIKYNNNIKICIKIATYIEY